MSTCVDRAPEFAWYIVVPATVQLQQGDLLDEFPIVVPSASLVEQVNEPVESEVTQSWTVERFNVIVLTQSCDFPKLDDRDDVILCPRYDYSEFVNAFPGLRGRSGWGSLRAGRVVDAYLINTCEIANHAFDYQVVNLREIFTVPLFLVKRIARDRAHRVRLLPPYREPLAQAFARKFMRVGLPIGLPREYPYER